MRMSHLFNRKSLQCILVLLPLAYICGFVCLACSQEERQTETAKHFLWSIQTKKNTTYLLGSMHLLRQDSYPLAEEIEAAYDDSQKIVFETDLDGMNDPAMQAKMMALGVYLDDQTLEQDITAATYKLLKERVVATGASMAQFDRLRPWFCGLMLTALELQRFGFDTTYGLDSHFFNKAKKDGKEKIFLESVEYQMNLFANMTPQEQEALLRQTLEDLEVVETMSADMLIAWKAGDADKLNEMMNISFKEHPGIYDRLLIQRNKEWVSKIEALTNQDDNVLVIVGAGHLVGKESLLKLLEQKGYAIEQR